MVLKKATYAVLSGVVGCMLLVVFFSALMRLETLVTVVPWIMAFNAAMVGYGLLDQLRERLPRPRLGGAAAGLATGLLSYAALNLLSLYGVGFMIFGLLYLLIFAGVGIAFGFLGAILAVKYFKLKV